MNKDEIKLYIPYLGSIFIFLGTLKLIIYYEQFQIDITFYLEFSEILTLFLSSLIYFITFLLIQYLFYFVLMPHKAIIDEERSLNDAMIENNLFKRISIYLSIYKIGFAFCTLWILGVPIWFWLHKDMIVYLYFLAIMIGICILICLLYELKRQLNIKFDIVLSIFHVRIIRTFLLFLFFTIVLANYEYNNVKYKKITLGTAIKVGDRTIASDSIYYFIGKTRNYVFFYDQTDKRTDVFPINTITKLMIKTNTR